MRCKATFELCSPVMLDPLSSFDGIVAYLACTEREKQDGVPPGCLDPDVVEDVIGNLPLKKFPGGGFYMASTVIYPRRPRESSVVIPRVTAYNKFTTMPPGVLETLVEKNAIEADAGPKKPHMISYTARTIDRVEYIVEVEDENQRWELNRLLHGLTHLGKKAGIGFGEIKGAMDWKMGDQRYFTREILTRAEDAPLRRMAPEALKNEFAEIEGPFVYTRIAPPYWRAAGGVLCGLATM